MVRSLVNVGFGEPSEEALLKSWPPSLWGMLLPWGTGLWFSFGSGPSALDPPEGLQSPQPTLSCLTTAVLNRFQGLKHSQL